MTELTPSFSMNQPLFHIGLSAWIIQDGNYPDFEQGSISRFALEFYSEHGLVISSKSLDAPGLIHRRDALHAVCGVVRFVAENVWVVDFGEVMAYRKEKPPRGIATGTTVTGEVYLGIDPFYYFERLFRMPEMPAIIYEWQVAGIDMETAPFIETTDHYGRTMLARDQSKRARVAVTRTDAWKDDCGNGDYVLHCRRTSSEVFRHLGEGGK